MHLEGTYGNSTEKFDNLPKETEGDRQQVGNGGWEHVKIRKKTRRDEVLLVLHSIDVKLLSVFYDKI